MGWEWVGESQADLTRGELGSFGRLLIFSACFLCPCYYFRVKRGVFDVGVFESNCVKGMRGFVFGVFLVEIGG